MKRLLITLLCLVAVISFAGITQYMQMVVARKNVTVGGGTDYTQDANCQGAWLMNADGGTSETDRSAVGNDLDVIGADTLPTSASVPDGYAGASRDSEQTDEDDFDTVSGYTNINGADQEISAFQWYNAESLVAFSFRGGFGNLDNGNATNISWMVQYIDSDGTDADSKMSVQFSSNGSTIAKTVDTTSEIVQTGTWVHVGFTYDDVNIILYTNGSANITSAYTAGTFDGTATFKANGSSQFDESDGLIDETIIFNRALSAAEVADIYTDGIDGTKGAND